MSMTKYDCAHSNISDLMDDCGMSEENQIKMYGFLDVMYDDLGLLYPSRNRESENMSEQLEDLVPKQIIALVAKAKGWIDYPDDGIEQGHYWHLDAKKEPFGPKVYKTAYDPFAISGQALQLVSEFGLSVKTTTIKTMPPTTRVIVSKGIDNQYSVSVQERKIEDMADYHSELERMIRQAVVMVVAKIGLDEPVSIIDQIILAVQEKEKDFHRELINVILNRRTFLDLLNSPVTFKLFDGPYSTEEPYFLMGYELKIVNDGPDFEVTADHP